MLDQSINYKSLAFVMSAREKYKYPIEYNHNSAIEQCLSLYKSNEDFPELMIGKINGKNVYKVNDLASEILLKRLNLTLKTINSACQDNRNQIIKSIKSLLTCNTPYSLLRLDIKTFYESINLECIINKICSDSAYSITTQNLLKKWQRCFEKSSVEGLPRGICLSATLSEYLMKDFDKKAKSIEGVFFYARFVDDIIIFTTAPSENVFNKLQKLLPNGLEFNKKPNKMKLIDIGKFHKKKSNNSIQFDYLGYSFKIVDSNSREVKIDLSENKQNKIKTRIIKSFLSYINNDDFLLLKKRIIFLTRNFYLFNKNRSTSVKSGIYFNYIHITQPNDKESGLVKLDKFMMDIIFSKNISYRILGKEHNLTMEKRKALAQYSFVSGHNRKLFYRFDPSTIKKIIRCWSY